MTARNLEERLRRMEGLLAMLVREAIVDREERDTNILIRDAYRRGYLCGHQQQRKGKRCDPDGAVAKQLRIR